MVLRFLLLLSSYLATILCVYREVPNLESAASSSFSSSSSSTSTANNNKNSIVLVSAAAAAAATVSAAAALSAGGNDPGDEFGTNNNNNNYGRTDELEPRRDRKYARDDNSRYDYRPEDGASTFESGEKYGNNDRDRPNESDERTSSENDSSEYDDSNSLEKSSEYGIDKRIDTLEYPNEPESSLENEHRDDDSSGEYQKPKGEDTENYEENDDDDDDDPDRHFSPIYKRKVSQKDYRPFPEYIHYPNYNPNNLDNGVGHEEPERTNHIEEDDGKVEEEYVQIYPPPTVEMFQERAHDEPSQETEGHVERHADEEEEEERARALHHGDNRSEEEEHRERPREIHEEHFNLEEPEEPRGHLEMHREEHGEHRMNQHLPHYPPLIDCPCQCPNLEPPSKHKQDPHYPLSHSFSEGPSQSWNKHSHKPHHPASPPAAAPVHKRIVPYIWCNFSQGDCDFVNDAYEDSRFRYGFSTHFQSKLWYVETREPLLVSDIGIEEPSRFKGWGRLVSPTYVNMNRSRDACVMIEFEFESEGNDQLTIAVQDRSGTRNILDYMHDRPNETDRLLLRKYVHFSIDENPRFFIQFEYKSRFRNNHYGLKSFQLFFGHCPSAKILEHNKSVGPH